MARLADFTATAGMNGGAAVYAKMMRLSDIQTAPELAEIFPVQSETLSAIIQSMKEAGYDKAEPLVLWKGKNTVVDGHTRLAAAREAGIEEVPVEEKEFETLDEAALYAYGRQAKRRNLTQAEIYKAATSLKTKCSRDGTGRSAEQLAERLGIAKTTVYNARAVGESGEEEIIGEVKKGGMSISKAYRQVKEKKEKARQPHRIMKNEDEDSFEETLEDEDAAGEVSAILEPDTDVEFSSPRGEEEESREEEAEASGAPLPDFELSSTPEEEGPRAPAIEEAITAVRRFLQANREEDLREIKELHTALEILSRIRTP